MTACVLCAAHVAVLTFSPIGVVHVACSEGVVRRRMLDWHFAVDYVDPLVEWTRRGKARLVFAILGALVRMIVIGPIQLMLRLIMDPDISRLLALGVLAPMAAAAVAWAMLMSGVGAAALEFMLPSGWLEDPAPDRVENVVLVTLAVLACVGVVVEGMRVFAPPWILVLVLGRLSLSLYLVGLAAAFVFACVLSCLHSDGILAKSPPPEGEQQDAGGVASRADGLRKTHLALLGIALGAVAVAHVVLPVQNRRQFATFSNS